MSQTTTTDTIQDRYKRAIAASRKRRVNVRQNVRSCCRGCAGYEMAQSYEDAGKREKIERTVWTFGRQGSAVRWDYDGTPYHPENSWGLRGNDMHPVQYWNFDDVQYAAILAEEFRREGFKVEWDGTQARCVEVYLNPKDGE